MPTGAYRAPRSADEQNFVNVCCNDVGHTNWPAVAAQPRTPAVRIARDPHPVRFGPALATEAETTTMAAVLCLAFDSRRLAVMFAKPCVQ